MDDLNLFIFYVFVEQICKYSYRSKLSDILKINSKYAEKLNIFDQQRQRAKFYRFSYNFELC